MPNTPRIVLIGGGGHARVLVDALRAAGETGAIAVLDADPARHGEMLLDATIAGGDEMLAALVSQGAKFFAVAVGGTRNNAPRAALYRRGLDLGLQPISIIHPRATVSPWASVGAGCQILAAAVVNAGAVLGANVIVNSGAIVEHDCCIGDHVHIATGARLASTVTVGDRAHIGAGSVVRQLITIGEASVVGAGAVVVKNVSAATVVAGVPAKELPK